MRSGVDSEIIFTKQIDNVEFAIVDTKKNKRRKVELITKPAKSELLEVVKSPEPEPKTDLKDLFFGSCSDEEVGGESSSNSDSGLRVNKNVLGISRGHPGTFQNPYKVTKEYRGSSALEDDIDNCYLYEEEEEEAEFEVNTGEGVIFREDDNLEKQIRNVKNAVVIEKDDVQKVKTDVLEVISDHASDEAVPSSNLTLPSSDIVIADDPDDKELVEKVFGKTFKEVTDEVIIASGDNLQEVKADLLQILPKQDDGKPSSVLALAVPGAIAIVEGSDDEESDAEFEEVFNKTFREVTDVQVFPVSDLISRRDMITETEGIPDASIEKEDEEISSSSENKTISSPPSETPAPLIPPQDLDSLDKELDQELVDLGEQHKKAMASSDRVDKGIISDVKELLEAFGVPFLVAPAEAEAQCAELCNWGMCDGVITEDSDIFLFGEVTVFRCGIPYCYIS